MLVGLARASGQCVVTTLAGWLNGTFGFKDGTGTTASFYNPTGVALDSASNVYVADAYNHAIRKINPVGVVTTFAGRLSGTSGFVDGTGTAAAFSSPTEVTLDSASNVYVADYANNAIRKITPVGVVTTLAGWRNGTSAFKDGTGTAAAFRNPNGVALDSASNVYVADYNNHAIRKINPVGVVTTLAGWLNGTFAFKDGTGTAAAFRNPRRVALDSASNVYVADYSNNAIRKITCPCSSVPGSYCLSNVLTPCPGGTFNANFGGVCEPCPRGHYCPLGSSSWNNCGRGNYCPLGSAAPLPCPIQVSPSGGWGAQQVQGPAFIVETAACYSHCFFNLTSGGPQSSC